MKRFALLVVAAMVLASVPTALLVQAQDANADVTVRPQPHPPILIQGDADFESPLSGVRSGNGTAEDPFVISNWTISYREEGIRLQNTTAHVLIQDVNLLTNPPTGFGIHLVNASNVAVQEVGVLNGLVGIYAEQAERIHIQNVDIRGTPSALVGFGINLEYTQSVDIDSVSIRNASFPIATGPSESTSIVGADMVGTQKGWGSDLFIGSGANDTLVAGSRLENVTIGSAFGAENYTIARNRFLGEDAPVEFSDRGSYRNVDICGNQVDGTDFGLELDQITDLRIRGNLLTDIPEDAVEIQQSTGVEFTRNRVDGTGDGSSSAVFASGAAIHHNLFQDNSDGLFVVASSNATHNWWADASGPNVNGNGPGNGTYIDTEGANITVDPWLTSPPETGPDSVDCGVDVRGEPGADLPPFTFTAAGEVEAGVHASGEEGTVHARVDAEERVGLGVGLVPVGS